MKCVYEGGSGEIEEKKSRFIANVSAIHSEDEAVSFIEKIRKQHYSARHNCYAYVFDNGNLMRSSDDGEPSGTAGRPILEVITGQGLTDTVIVVTRYFGGILLGTGGLVRAYTEAAKEGLNNSVIIDKEAAVLFSVKCDYTLIGKLQHTFGENNINVISSEYSDSVSFELAVLADAYEKTERLLNDVTSANITIEKQRDCLMAGIGGEIKIFD